MPLVGGRHGPLIHAQDEPRPAGALEAVRAELLQVLALGGVAGVVPVADVDEADGVDEITLETLRDQDRGHL